MSGRKISGRRIGQAGLGEFAGVTAVSSAFAVLVALVFATPGTASQTGPQAPAPRANPTSAASPQPVSPTTTPTTTSTTTPVTPTATPTTEAVTATMVTEAVAIPFGTRSVEDAALDQGKTALRTAGVAGRKTVTYLVTMKGGVEVSRSVSGEQVTLQPVEEVTAIGTKTPPPPPTAKPTPAPTPTPTPAKTESRGQCDPNYSGACVPIATDVDCMSGKGNGPAYVRGPVRVIGTDIYDLDSDGDGIGCEKG